MSLSADIWRVEPCRMAGQGTSTRHNIEPADVSTVQEIFTVTLLELISSYPQIKYFESTLLIHIELYIISVPKLGGTSELLKGCGARLRDIVQSEHYAKETSSG